MSLPSKATKDVPLLQEGSYVLKTYSKGISRRRLETMAASCLNRRGAGVFGRHAHDIYKPIAGKDGLAVWRYGRGLMLSPNPENPFENADFTNDYVARQRNLLAPVTREHHPGAFSKTHLWHSHLTAKQGSFVYYDDKKPMVPNYGCSETAITMEHGLFFEELDYEAFVKHPKAIGFLMDGENADASQALSETELSVIQCYFESCRKVVVRPGLELWQAVDEETGLGTTWNDDYKRAACEFSSLIATDQMKMLVAAYQFYMNPKVMRIGQAQLKAASRLPAKYPWCKLAPIIANIVTTNLVQDKLSATCRGNAVPDAALDVLRSVKSLGESTYALVEASIKDVMGCYQPTAVQGLDSHTSLIPGCIQFHEKLTCVNSGALLHSLTNYSADDRFTRFRVIRKCVTL